MFLSAITDKEIVSGATKKGICRGVGVSLKSHAVKYLLCASDGDTDFSVSASAVERVDEQITLSSLRPLFPKRCARIFIGRPVYSFDGAYLGKVVDLEIREFIATNLFTDQNERYPINAVFACRDAVIIKKEQPYPLGQRVPTPILPLFTEKKDAVVSKQILRTAIEKGKLISLTLSLAPFRFGFF